MHDLIVTKLCQTPGDRLQVEQSYEIHKLMKRKTLNDFKTFCFLDASFFELHFLKTVQGITNLTQDIQRTWVGIQRTQILHTYVQLLVV